MEPDVELIVREYLEKSLHMSLATVSHNLPWVCEVHFVRDDDLNLYWRSLTSRRHSQEIAQNPHVAGNIVKQHELGEYPAAIYFEGTGSLLTTPREREQIFDAFRVRFGLTESILEDASRPEGHQFYKATISDWYAFGKFGGDQGQKLALKRN